MLGAAQNVIKTFLGQGLISQWLDLASEELTLVLALPVTWCDAVSSDKLLYLYISFLGLP